MIDIFKDVAQCGRLSKYVIAVIVRWEVEAFFLIG